jgi:hypothetical protein
MRRRPWLVALTIPVLLIAGCDDDVTTVTGSGEIVTEGREVTGFDEIEVTGLGQVVVEVTGTESLTVEGDDNVLPLLETEVSDGRLELRVPADTRFDLTEMVVYRVTASELSGLSVVASADIRATGIDAESFEIDIAGSGDIEVAGRTGSIDIEIAGSGNVDAAEVLASRGEVDIAGSGDVTLNASETLDVAINGSGNVKYLGRPELDQSINGSGTISRVER